MKLCVFQGTFNPVHNAHVRMVKYVIEKYNFDKLIVIPAFQPPHKNTNPQMSLHRLNMAKLAFKDIPKVEVSDIEFRRGGKSYTYLTICELYEKFDIEGKIHFIIGTDAFKNINSWYEADKLKKLVEFIVFDRGVEVDCELANLTFKDVSSSQIRSDIDKADEFLPQTVKEYIHKYGLYKNKS